jgi:hypothetical protein
MLNILGILDIPKCVLESPGYMAMLDMSNNNIKSFIHDVPTYAKLWITPINSAELVRGFDYWGCTFAEYDMLINYNQDNLLELVIKFGIKNILVDKFINTSRILHTNMCIDVLKCIDNIIQTHQYDVFAVITNHYVGKNKHRVLERVAMFGSGKIIDMAFAYLREDYDTDDETIHHHLRSVMQNNILKLIDIAIEMDNIEFISQCKYAWTEDQFESAITFNSLKCVKYIYENIKHIMLWVGPPTLEPILELYSTRAPIISFGIVPNPNDHPLNRGETTYTNKYHDLRINYQLDTYKRKKYNYITLPFIIDTAQRYSMFKYLIDNEFKITPEDILTYIIPSGCVDSVLLVMHLIPEECYVHIITESSSTVSILKCMEPLFGTALILQYLNMAEVNGDVEKLEYICSLGYNPTEQDIIIACLDDNANYLKVLYKYQQIPDLHCIHYTSDSIECMQIAHSYGDEITRDLLLHSIYNMNIECINYIRRNKPTLKCYIASHRINHINIYKYTYSNVRHCHLLGLRLHRSLCKIAVLTHQLDLLKYLHRHGIKSSETLPLAIRKKNTEFIEYLS